MRRRHPLLFWLGAFWFLRHFMRRGRHLRHGSPDYGHHHGHHRRHDYDYV